MLIFKDRKKLLYLRQHIRKITFFQTLWHTNTLSGNLPIVRVVAVRNFMTMTSVAVVVRIAVLFIISTLRLPPQLLFGMKMANCWLCAELKSHRKGGWTCPEASAT